MSLNSGMFVFISLIYLLFTYLLSTYSLNACDTLETVFVLQICDTRFGGSL